jgi:Signal transduction histidine kinase
LWCGSFDEGIEVIDLDKMRVIKKYSKDDGKSNLSSNLISSLLLSSHGDILVGSDNGVQLYDSKSDSFVTFNSELNGALQLFEDSKQNLWVVNNYDISVLTPNKNLSRYNFTNKKVLSITEDKDNIIWIATSKGIEYFDKEKREFIPNNFTSNDKATNFTYRIEEDEDGFFWISTGNGLVCFHPHKKHNTYILYKKAFQKIGLNANSSFKDDNGDIYMGTINGFTSFNPQFPKDASILPSLIITKLTCMGKNGGRDIYFSSYKKIKEEINYNENSITIEFSSLTYSAPNTLKYKYRLDPLDKSWHELEGTTTINYNSLPYGEYNLKIKSTDYYGNWLDNEINHSIEILPPFYATLLAKILYGLVLLIIIIQIIRHYQKRVVNKQKRAIDELKSKTEKELYLTKINFFTTIVHEIRTPLTLIKIPLEKEMETNNNDNLLLIEKNVDRLTKLCSQLLDFRKVESNQLQLNFVKTDIPDFISNIIFRFMPLIKSKEIQFTHNLQDVNLIAPIDREAFTKIVSNLLNNSIKYADSIIQLNVSKKDKVFELSIKNDGAKIIGEDRKQIFDMFF